MTDRTDSIRELPTEAVERIAAGEVITRPVRVVAELVENALDADASRIDVSVDGDGTERITVADDGHGLGREDAVRAVEPHTTSKIRDAEDLRRADTLGFRGEALASIADAARELELMTNDGDGTGGTRVVVREDGDHSAGGNSTGTADEEPSVSEAGRARGTTVTVSGLFADRRARRESLASAASEFGRISTLVGRYALLHDDVAFTLEHDGREVLSTPGTGVTDSLLAVYDRETAGQSTRFAHETTVDFPEESDTLSVSGHLVYPSITRSDRSHVHVAVDGRPVRNEDLRRAVTAGYGTLLSDGAEPVAVVEISVPPTAVDANVHPAKQRVALGGSEAVCEAVTTAVREALTTADLRRSGEVAMDLDSSLEPVEATESDFTDATVVGQYRDLYVLCESDEDLLVVDQHAAHERINFERLREAVVEGAETPATAESAETTESSVPTREIDPPATLSLDPETATAVADNTDTLRELGFTISSFGGTTYRVERVPAPLGRTAAPESLRETARRLADSTATTDPYTDPREEILAELACHPSLKAGDDLDRETAKTLLDRLGQCEQPYACPHGRPTVLTISEATLASGFERENTRL